ncbi:MAG: sialidase family protein [Actinomycetota bacterium]
MGLRFKCAARLELLAHPAHRRDAKAGKGRNLAGASALFVKLKNPFTHRHRDGSHDPSWHLTPSKSSYIIYVNALTVALSSDGDQTWPSRRNVAEGPYDYAYPMVVQTRDGKIHLIFTSHERTIVNHAVLDEDWIKQGGPVTRWLPKK